MKCVTIFMILFLAVRAQDPPECEGRGCPIKCPPGTYLYAPDCDYLQPPSTCKNPNPPLSGSIICDYQACYCSPPTVRNEDTNECVSLKDCPCDSKNS